VGQWDLALQGGGGEKQTTGVKLGRKRKAIGYRVGGDNRGVSSFDWNTKMERKTRQN